MFPKCKLLFESLKQPGKDYQTTFQMNIGSQMSCVQAVENSTVECLSNL